MQNVDLALTLDNTFQFPHLSSYNSLPGAYNISGGQDNMLVIDWIHPHWLCIHWLITLLHSAVTWCQWYEGTHLGSHGHCARAGWWGIIGYPYIYVSFWIQSMYCWGLYVGEHACFSTLCKGMILKMCCRIHIPQQSHLRSIGSGIIPLCPDQ